MLTQIKCTFYITAIISQNKMYNIANVMKQQGAGLEPSTFEPGALSTVPQKHAQSVILRPYFLAFIPKPYTFFP